jgi:hypothetical protein
LTLRYKQVPPNGPRESSLIGWGEGIAGGTGLDIFILVVIMPVTIAALLIVCAKHLSTQFGKSKATRLSVGESRFLWISFVCNVAVLLGLNFHRLF